MALEMRQEDGGRILIVEVSGKLTKQDYEQFVPEVERLMTEHGKISVLFDMKDFHGWKARAIWEDIKFDARHHADLERLAIVGDKRWQKWMATVCKPFTSAKVRYFERGESDEALAWLTETLARV